MSTLVDSNVLLDIFTKDEQWYDWSFNALLDAQERNGIFINAVIYGEISIRFDRQQQVDQALAGAGIAWLDLPREVAFSAGKAFRSYRKRGGTRGSTLPDFFIGAHAAVSDLALLTRDPARYRSYFPDVRLVTP